MEKLSKLKAELKHLDRLIEAGEKFEEQGHDCLGMNYLNIILRNKIKKEIEVLEHENI